MQRRYQIIDRKLQETEDEKAPISIFVNPNDAEKQYLINDLKIDEHTLASALDPDELSRLEFEPEHLAMIYKRPRNYSGQDQFLFKVSSAGAFLFPNQLVLVVSEDVPLLDVMQKTRINSIRDLILKLIFRATIHFREHLKVIATISDDLQDKISKSMENRHLLNMFTLQKSLVYYLNSIDSNSVLLERLRHNETKIGFTIDELELLDDILIENNQCYKQADIYSNILAGLMDARASIVSNNLNVLMKTLNIITIAIMVPTFVVSAFSMNVPIPLGEHPFAFVIIMGLALTSVLTFLLFWRFRKQ
jgi:magnesium transporter